MVAGRPTEYTKELAAEICAEFSTNPRASMKSVSEKFDFAASTIFKWLADNDSFSEMYARAKQEQSELLVDEMLSIADDGKLDTETRIAKDGTEYEATKSDVIQRSRLMIDTRKWIAAKLKPKKYGDKLDLTSDGKGLQPVIIVPANSTQEEWEEFDDSQGGEK